MPTYVYECPVHGRIEVVKQMRDVGRDECCRACLEAAFDRSRPPEEQAPFRARTPWKMRRIYTPQGFIMRPSGYRLSPEDPKFSDFRREMALGELREDATPVTLSPSELAAYDDPPIAIPPDPERDYQLAQAVRQNWTEDLSPGVAYNRELAAKAARGSMTDADAPLSNYVIAFLALYGDDLRRHDVPEAAILAAADDYLRPQTRRAYPLIGDYLADLARAHRTPAITRREVI